MSNKLPRYILSKQTNKNLLVSSPTMMYETPYPSGLTAENPPPRHELSWFQSSVYLVGVWDVLNTSGENTHCNNKTHHQTVNYSD